MKNILDYVIIFRDLYCYRLSNETCLLRCQVVIPSYFTGDDIRGIFIGMEEVETFEVI